jgi:hypothetical protein
MKVLLYGICQQDADGFSHGPGTRVVTGHGLMAVVSELEGPTTAPSVPSLLAYERVVEAIHARQTVIPLRYGCVMESEEQIVQLLEDHHREYEALLGRLRGMTEMGIRLLWSASAAPPPSLAQSPGAAYLTSLRNRYNSQETLIAEEVLLADQIVVQLAGWSTEQRREVSSSHQGRLLSLYFLTPKSGAEEFRKVVRTISIPRGVKLLLSGPWPPYNFVCPPPDSMECKLWN